jgi:hypothetical protein
MLDSNRNVLASSNQSQFRKESLCGAPHGLTDTYKD